VTTDAIKALATIEDALPALANAIAQAAATDRVKADHRAVCEQIAAMHAAAVGEVRAPLLGYVEDVASVRHAFEAQRARADTLDRLCGEQRTRADAAEAERGELHAALGLAPGQLHSAALSAIRGRGVNIRELATRAEKAEKRGDHWKRVAQEMEADRDREAAAREQAQQDAKEAKERAEHYRDTRRRWAEHADGEYAQHRDRADTAEQALAEQKKRADNAWACAAKAEAVIARINDARQSADVWAALGMHYGWTPEQSGRAARARRTTAEQAAEQRAELAERALYRMQQDWRRAHWAWRSARRRASRRAEQPVSVVRFEASAIADQIDDAIRRAFRAHRTR
jgi:hypothetical protein